MVGSQTVFEHAAIRRFVELGHFRMVGVSETLLGGLDWLEREAVELILLSEEFRRSELALFSLDAVRRGFTGAIFHMEDPARGTSLATSAVSMPIAKRPQLTARQRTVLMRVVEGWSNREIAKELLYSESAVKAVLQELFTMFQVRRRSHLVRLTLLDATKRVSNRRSPR